MRALTAKTRIPKNLLTAPMPKEALLDLLKMANMFGLEKMKLISLDIKEFVLTTPENNGTLELSLILVESNPNNMEILKDAQIQEEKVPPQA